jgi:hypothetical protein
MTEVGAATTEAPHSATTSSEAHAIATRANSPTARVGRCIEETGQGPEITKISAMASAAEMAAQAHTIAATGGTRIGRELPAQGKTATEATTAAERTGQATAPHSTRSYQGSIVHRASTTIITSTVIADYIVVIVIIVMVLSIVFFVTTIIIVFTHNLNTIIHTACIIILTLFIIINSTIIIKIINFLIVSTLI